MRIVVTGALGHIGSRLIRTLPSKFKGCEVVMVDNFLTQRYSSLFFLPHQGKYKFIEADVTKINLMEIFRGADVVVHLAQIADLAHEYIGQKDIERINYKGLVNVANMCADVGVKLFFPSTSSVYGTNKMKVVEDDEGDLKPQSQYAENKLRCEKYLKTFAAKSGLRYCVFRWGTIFGVSPGMRFNTAVNRFCLEAACGRPLSVWRTAYRQFRPYLDLDDAVESLVFLIKKDLFGGQTYNVATVNSRVSDVVGIIRKLVGGVRVNLIDHPIMSDYSYKISSDKIKNEGFVFRGDLEKGIVSTLAQFKNVS